jgi:ectoine hydroxylase-related dioxygenase (phytanoyl-CoA dioxygenase family)
VVARYGFAVVDDVASPEIVAGFAAMVDALVHAEFDARMEEAHRRAEADEQRIEVWPEERGVVHLTFEPSDDRFQSLTSHRFASALAAELLGPHVHVAGVSLRVPLPGFGHQGLHQDTEPAADRGRWHEVRVTWVLSPFVVETGTLRVIPGSHLTGPPNEPAVLGMPPHPDEVRVIAEPGAVVLRGNEWHSGTFNASSELRLSIDVDYRAREPDGP